MLVFIHLVSTDLDRSRAFYSTVGTIDAEFTSEEEFTVDWGNAYLTVGLASALPMYTSKPWADPAHQAQTIVTRTVDSRDEADALAEAAIAAGGREAEPPFVLDEFYKRTLEDPDGNLIALFYPGP